jgi:hemerythrin-like domain-containing protein
MDAFTVLGEDHDEILDLLARIERLQPATTDVPAQRNRERENLVSRLIQVEASHQAMEKSCFWPAVRNELPDGPRLASSAWGREETARHVLARLDRTSPGQPEFERLLDAAAKDIRAHITYEQTTVWPKVRATLSEERLTQLGEHMARARATTPIDMASKP